MKPIISPSILSADFGYLARDIEMIKMCIRDRQETHDFDRTIGAIYEWAAKDGETLVVVTADHETCLLYTSRCV